LRQVGVRVTPGWLFGVTGEAFLAGLSADDAPGPACIENAAAALGARVDILTTAPDSPPPETRVATLSAIRAAMASGAACYAFDAASSEFRCMVDCGQGRYQYVGRGRHGGAAEGACDLAGPGWVAVVNPAPPCSDLDAIRGGVRVGVEHGDRSLASVAKARLAGLDEGSVPSDIVALVAGTEERYGYAVEFTWEAKERLRGQHAPLFNEAAEEYDRAARALRAARETVATAGLEPGARAARRSVAEAVTADARGRDILRALLDTL